MKLTKLAPFLLILVLGIILFVVRREYLEEVSPETPEQKSRSHPSKKSTRGLNRYPASIVYSKHAQCRMACRDITKAEVKTVLEHGQINYRKSDLQQEECHKRYAVEDEANGQHIRIVVAACENKLTVITCIDLDKEWACHCPGDEQH